MVGNEKSIGYFCDGVSVVCLVPGCASGIATGTGLFECLYSTLAYAPFAAYVSTEDQTTTETAAETGLHDAGAGGEVSLAFPEDAALGEILSYWLVHGIEAISDNRPEVVDGRS